MNDNSQILRAFNDHFMELIADVELVFKGDREVETLCNAFRVFRRLNPKLIIVTYKDQVVSKYREAIEKDDFNFWLEHDYHNDIHSNFEDPNNNTAGEIVKKIDELRETISKMEENNKKKVLTYIKNLMKISDLYN